MKFVGSCCLIVVHVVAVSASSCNFVLLIWFYFIFRLGNSSTWHCPRNPVYSACLYRLVPIFRSNLSELVLLRSYQLFFFYRSWRKSPMTPHLYSLTFKMLLLSSHALHFNKRRKILRENSFMYINWSVLPNLKSNGSKMYQ